MNDDKQYLFAANGSYFGSCMIALIFAVPMVYGIIDRDCVYLREANVFMDPLGVALLLYFETAMEACMMIKGKRHLFAYNIDRAICVSLDNMKLDDAAAIARKLYGPVFDEDCAKHFASKPKSPWLRNVFYIIVITLFSISVTAPCYHGINAIQSGTWTAKLIAAWIFILLDVIMLVNRLFFRASIRKFWAWTFGGKKMRLILRMELTDSNGPIRIRSSKPYFVSKGVLQEFSWKRTALTAIVSIALIVLASNFGRWILRLITGG